MASWRLAPHFGSVALASLITEQFRIVESFQKIEIVNRLVCGPTFEHAKLVLSIAIDLIPQASLLPLFTWAAVSEALPDPFRYNVTA